MAATAEHVYTPSELNREARLHLEAGFGRVVVEGEISNLSKPASGHRYFSLKDDKAQLRCALFRSAAMKSGLRLENGMKVLARGRISLYEPRGDFQMIVDSVQEAGEGELQRQFEALKQKLQDEGLFDPARKRPLPTYPLRIGLVTSPRGAAVRDILQVLQRRWPLARVRLYPVLVQGEGAALEIRRALEAANRHSWSQLLIVGRGGGSLEDLAAFNDEGVARAVHASAVPVVSAVGHETDFSICDFVADLRAPTPSAAAELATPDQTALRETFGRSARQLLRRMRDRLHRDSQRLDHLGHRLQQRHPASGLVEQRRRLQNLDAAARRAIRRSLDSRAERLQSASARLAAHRPERRVAELAVRLATARRALERLARDAVRARSQQLGDLARTLHAVSPLAVIGRGYAVLTSPETGAVISSVEQIDTGERLFARLKDGRLDCRVESVSPVKALE
ncbi:MAG: exodeoxyribonuclease VII large subunit, partial [Xanthomonadales bacterium]|nr:exodeoxyribonuclease VII large subunit [Xanthomonadales bacterium]